MTLQQQVVIASQPTASWLQVVSGNLQKNTSANHCLFSLELSQPVLVSASLFMFWSLKPPYHQYFGGCSLLWRDITNIVGHILSIVESVQGKEKKSADDILPQWWWWAFSWGFLPGGGTTNMQNSLFSKSGWRHQIQITFKSLILK